MEVNKMKNFKKLLAISFLLTILTVLMMMQGWNIKTVNSTQLQYNTFPIQPYTFSSSLITNGSIKYLSLPSDSMPMGILYDSAKNKVWIALYLNSSIASVDVSTMNTTIYPLPYRVDENFSGPRPWTLTIDPDNCIWFSIKEYMNPHPSTQLPILGKLDLSNNTAYIYYLPVALTCGCDIKFYNDYIWYLTKYTLSKINYTTGELVESYMKDFYGDGYIAPDGDCLWLSSVQNNFVTRFNITSKNFDINLTGFNRPLGMYVDSTKLYVAENKYSGDETIAVVDKSTLNISRITTGAVITHQGVYHVYKSLEGNLWWSDNSGHVGSILLNGTKLVYDAPQYCYFMTEVPGNSIWFSAVVSAYVGSAYVAYVGIVGSAYVGIVEDITITSLSSSHVAGPAGGKFIR
jgi:DNA-binding beta-propeller fold protein YncE